MERWQPERLPARFQPRSTTQPVGLRAWLPLGAVVAIVSLGMLVYALSSGSSLYRVIRAGHSAPITAPIATPSPSHTGRVPPDQPALQPTHHQGPG